MKNPKKIGLRRPNAELENLENLTPNYGIHKLKNTTKESLYTLPYCNHVPFDFPRIYLPNWNSSFILQKIK